MPDPVPEISVVVPTYNQAHRLPALFEALEAQQLDQRFEVILADDASSDSTPEVVRVWQEKSLPFARVYERLPDNGGPGRARNAGARVARGRIVAFTDSDCRPHADWLLALSTALDANATIVGAGGRVLPAQENVFSHYLTYLRVLEPPEHAPYLVTCNAAYLREDFWAAGGFPEDIGVPGGEDIELSIKIWKRGGRFRYVPEAVVVHEHRDTFRSYARTWRNYGYGTGLVILRSLSREEQAGGSETEENFWRGDYLFPTLQAGRARAVLAECRRRQFSLKHQFKAMILWATERAMYWYGWRQGARRAARSPTSSVR